MFKYGMYSTFHEAPTDGAGGSSTVADLDTLLEGMDKETNTDGQNTDTTADTAAQDNTDAAKTQPEQNNQQDEPTKANPSQSSKMNFAFGQMRTELNAYKGLLSKLATASGITYTDEKDLISKLNDDALNKLATRQNVPVDLLKRMEQLENNNAMYEAEQRKTDTMVSFQKLQATYGLTNDELIAFAQELDERGLNPFNTRVNIDSVYKDLHFDEIVNKRVTLAVQEALKKSSVADTHSSTPNTHTGRKDNSGSDKKITTVSQLSDLLDGVK